MSRSHRMIHTNVSASAFRAMVKNFERVRYCILPDGRLNVGHADHYIHCSIYEGPENLYYESNKEFIGTICGYAEYQKNADRLRHYVHYQITENIGDQTRVREDFDLAREVQHKVLTDIEAKGFERTRDMFHFVS